MASNRWDALLNESTWYVPAANLLAYRLDSTNPTTPIPAADQTIWSIGTAEGGQFTGQSIAKIVDATGAVTTSLTTMNGRVTERGQVRITFTTPIGSTITGIGQVRRVNGVQAMEMQMITGGGGAYTTHWAYMLPLTDGTTPPDPATDPGEQATYRSGRYRWLRGTSWTIEPQGRQRARGRFTINGYRNGYFWGSGRERGSNESFEVLGSITPEGNVFLNAIDSDDFQLRLSQGGLLRGPRRGPGQTPPLHQHARPAGAAAAAAPPRRLEGQGPDHRRRRGAGLRLAFRRQFRNDDRNGRTSGMGGRRRLDEPNTRTKRRRWDPCSDGSAQRTRHELAGLSNTIQLPQTGTPPMPLTPGQQPLRGRLSR
ncbi:MAG: hypothetical protein R6W06_13845 [Prochlorococcaceae cyanobacterium]